jgi:hypothetical protein
VTTIDGPSPALTLGVVAILSYTVVKAGVVYGRGDHMLHHRSRAFHSFPVLGLVGLPDRPVRPVAVDDVARCWWPRASATSASRTARSWHSGRMSCRSAQPCAESPTSSGGDPSS